jgi:Flp pilus assembly protein TadD
VEISPTQLVGQAILGSAHAQLRQYEQAVTTFQEALRLSKGHPLILGLLGYTYGIAGNRLEAERVLKQLQELPVNRPYLATSLAAVYTGLADKDQAFHWLDEAWRNRDSWIIFLKVDPQWESLRSDPRFDQLLERLDLVDKRGAGD